MSLPKFFFIISLFLFGSIGTLAMIKRSKERKNLQRELLYEKKKSSSEKSVQEVPISSLEPLYKQQHFKSEKPIASSLSKFEDEFVVEGKKTKANSPVIIDHDDRQDSIKMLFDRSSAIPIVKTIRYSRKVSWKSKKPAWIIDYVNHYKTPLDFIYKSIQIFQPQIGSSDGWHKNIAEGVEFNVFRDDLNFQFYLVVSFASTRLRLYYILPEEKKAVFLKSYPVCLGKKDSTKRSGSLTPFGLYQLGTNIAIYQPKIMESYRGKRVEMMQFFGTRWIPFEREVDPTSCTEPSKGFGIHGLPFYRDSTDNLIEDSSSIGRFESEGCIRLNQKDMEELYSLISLRKAYVEIVPDFTHSRLMKGQI